MTVEQVRALPDPPGGRYELHHGELVIVSGPKLGHWEIQHNLVKLLSGPAGKRGVVGMDFGFRALPEHEWREADVAFTSRERYRATNREDNLRGAPEIVIEVLSRSNTKSEMSSKESLCLENGCLEFWVVDSKRNTVRVSKPNEVPKTYRAGDQIPLLLFGDARISVDAIFESLE